MTICYATLKSFGIILNNKQSLNFPVNFFLHGVDHFFQGRYTSGLGEC